MRRGCIIVAIVAALVGAQPASAGASTTQAPSAGTATVTGQITDAATGAPLAGVSVEVQPLTAGYAGGSATTDVNGDYSIAVSPQRYSIFALPDLSLYYPQYLGGPVGGVDPPVSVDPPTPGTVLTMTASGPNVYGLALTPATNPFVGFTGFGLMWTPVRADSADPHPPFNEMSLTIGYSASAALPPGWPADVLITQLKDGTSIIDQQAAPLAAADDGTIGGGGIGSGESAITVDCGGFSRGGTYIRTSQLTVTAYLQSDPSVTTTVTPTVDDAACRATKLEVVRVDERGWVGLTVLRRAGLNVVGIARLKLDDGRAITRRITREHTLIDLRPLLRHGINTVVTNFTPADAAGYVTPMPVSIRLRWSGR
jgi:hypothetical protein